MGVRHLAAPPHLRTSAPHSPITLINRLLPPPLQQQQVQLGLGDGSVRQLNDLEPRPAESVAHGDIVILCNRRRPRDVTPRLILLVPLAGSSLMSWRGHAHTGAHTGAHTAAHTLALLSTACGAAAAKVGAPRPGPETEVFVQLLDQLLTCCFLGGSVPLVMVFRCTFEG